MPTNFPASYKPIRWLGEGSVGDVWLAQHRNTLGHCAIKVLNIGDDSRGSAERSFNREVRAMARLSHPSIIEVFDFGHTDKKSPFVAMEHVPGYNLSSYIKETWSWSQLWTLIDGTLSGLSHAHARDLVHRDLKPTNILVVPHIEGLGAIKIVDFGIALATRDAEKASKRIEGTPAYIAPEAAMGQVNAIGPWTDLYSFGVILFEIITGRLPFYGRNLLNHHQHTPPPEMRVRPDVEIPEGFLAIIEKLLEKNAAARYHSVAALRKDLIALQAPSYASAFQNIEQDDEDDSYFDSLFDMSDDNLSDHEDVLLEPMTSSLGVALFHLRNPPLVGRKKAQQQLEEITQRVLDGNGPQVVLIEGEAGLGKSRLVEWLKIRVEEWGLMQTCMVRSEPQTRGGALKQSILRLMAMPQANENEANHLLSHIFPDPIARQNTKEALWPIESSEDLESRFQHATRILLDLAQHQPLLFWADDAHWSAEGRILRLIHSLASHSDQPILLIATLRPTQRRTVKTISKALLSMGATIIRLKPIPQQVLTSSLSALVTLPEGLVELACAQSNGNPLIAVEAIRGYLKDQGIAQAPKDPSEVLRQRIDQTTAGPMGGSLRSLLARSTLLGRSFTSSTLLKLCAVPGDPQAKELVEDEDLVHNLLDRAVQAGLIKEQRQRFVYKHDLIRVELKEIAQNLPNWAELNLATAALRLPRAKKDTMGVELEMVARNYWAGGLQQKALDYALQSLQQLMQSGLMGHATSVARRILSWDDTLLSLSTHERCELCLSGGEAATHAGHHAEAENYISEAITLAHKGALYDLGARGTAQMALSMLQADRLDRANHYFTEVQQFLQLAQQPAALSFVHFALGYASLSQQKEHEAIEHFEESLNHAMLEEGLLFYQLSARLALAKITRMQGLIQKAERSFHRIHHDAIQANLEVCSLEARLGLGLCAWKNNDASTALPYFKEVRKSARNHLFILEFYAAIGEAWAYALQSDWDQAQIALLQAESLRLDVPHRDQELESLRIEMKEYAIHCKRLDLISQLDKLSDLSIMGNTTYQN